MSLFRVILLLIFGWYMLAIFGRYLFPWLLRLLFNSAAEKMSKQMGGNQAPPRQIKKEGEVTISRKQTNANNPSGQTGYDDEYVDFEEIP